jgi:hypothetical protein
VGQRPWRGFNPESALRFVVFGEGRGTLIYLIFEDRQINRCPQHHLGLARPRHTSLPYLAIAVGYLTNTDRGLWQASWNPLGGLVLVTAPLTAVVTVRQWASLREHSQLLDKYHTLAATDALIGLPSRRRLLELAETELDHAKHRGQPPRRPDDRCGPLQADQRPVRPPDRRPGPVHHRRDLPEPDAPPRPARPVRGDELIAVLRDTSAHGAAGCRVAAPGTLLARADTALYTAKGKGRDCTCTYSHA